MVPIPACPIPSIPPDLISVSLNTSSSPPFWLLSRKRVHKVTFPAPFASCFKTGCHLQFDSGVVCSFALKSLENCCGLQKMEEPELWKWRWERNRFTVLCWVWSDRFLSFRRRWKFFRVFIVRLRSRTRSSARVRLSPRSIINIIYTSAELAVF